MTPSKDPPEHPLAWLFAWTAAPHTPRVIFWLLFLVCGALVALDAVVTRSTHFEFEKSLGFYGFFGFAAFVFIVQAARLLRLIVKRDETYYDH